MSLSRVLKHTAIPIGRVTSDVWVEGERTVDEEEGKAFPCVIFPPLGTEIDRRGKQINKPQFLCLQNYPDGTPISLRSGDRLKIEAPELAAGLGYDECWRFHYELDGDPQPLFKPGVNPLKGLYALLREVKD